MFKTQVIPPTPPAYLQPGEIIAGRYRLERELGRGAMGTVWSAVHVTLGQRVAIKLIAAEHVDSPEARLRFANEAKAAARLKSRHVVQVYDDGVTADGMPFIVMEYLEGETLEARIERTGELPLPEAVRVTTHVARALARAHVAGIVHRDLKPANIFITRSEDDELGWIAKVLDFGVAKLMGPSDASHTKTGVLVGTPLFMSPEQVRGASQVDGRSDLYSLGTVFYTMVTGRFAFDAPSYSDVLIKICVEPLPDLKHAAPWIPESVRDWFYRACAREPHERFQSADEMCEALHQASGQRRVDRASVPDPVVGPTGTVVGYGSPDPGAGGTLVMSREQAPPAPQLAPMPPTDATLVAAYGGVASRKAPLWPLLLAAGVGLTIAATGGAILFLVAGPPAENKTTLATPSANVVSVVPTQAPLVTTVATPALTPEAPPTALPSTAESRKPSTRSERERATAAQRPTAAPPRSTSRLPPAKGRAPSATPDIGF